MVLNFQISCYQKPPSVSLSLSSISCCVTSKVWLAWTCLYIQEVLRWDHRYCYCSHKPRKSYNFCNLEHGNYFILIHMVSTLKVMHCCSLCCLYGFCSKATADTVHMDPACGHRPTNPTLMARYISSYCTEMYMCKKDIWLIGYSNENLWLLQPTLSHDLL